jgi:hypothetical protein
MQRVIQVLTTRSGPQMNMSGRGTSLGHPRRPSRTITTGPGVGAK